MPYKAILIDLPSIKEDAVPATCTKHLFRTLPIVVWGNPVQLGHFENAYSIAVGRNHHAVKRIMPIYHSGNADADWIQDHLHLMVILPGQSRNLVVCNLYYRGMFNNILYPTDAQLLQYWREAF